VITKVRAVFLFVADQDRSLEFYTEKLGMEKVADDEMWPGARWLEVAPPGAETTISLAAAKDFDRKPGQGSAPVTFSAPDVHKLYEELKTKDVEVTEPVKESWSTYIRFTDPDGHEFLVGEA
jgi:lactoylglutathione lyase